MSNFLSQFDKSNYNSNPAPPPAVNTIRTEPVVVVGNSDIPEFHEKISDSDGSEVAIPVAIQGPVHKTEVDGTFRTNMIIRAAIIAAAVIAVCVTGIFIFRAANRIDIMSLIGKNISEAQSWALRNRITLDVVNEFNTEYEKDIVFAQTPEEGKIQRGSIMSITVSKGADPDEIIPIPDFSEMKMGQIRNWISENSVLNARVIQEYSDKAEQGGFLRIEFRDDMVDESNYTRKDTLNIYVSRGAEPVAKNITVPSFKDKTKEEIEAWANSNKIIVVFEEEESDKIAAERVIAQIPPSGTKISPEEEITVVMSLGKGVTVPDFNTVPKSEAAVFPDLMVEVTTKFSVTVPYGGVISQSVAAGTKLYGEDKRVKVVYSEGQPYIEDLIGRAENLLPAYFYEFKVKGANITYTWAYVNSSAPKGTVVSASHTSQFVDMNTSVYVEISLGNLPPEEPPNYPNYPNNEPNYQDNENPESPVGGVTYGNNNDKYARG